MFFQLAARNSRRNRKENGMFFVTLLVSIVSFYIILSLSHQDVMSFLKQMESDAVNKLMQMIPIFYVATLFILFFLLYYAGQFQLKRHQHEFGVYLMMGMQRSKLFFLLLIEDFRSSVLALMIGMPIAVLLSELISLITARLVGLTIIGHRFSFSLQAAIWTIAGFLLIKFAAFLILSGKVARKEIGELLTETPEGVKAQMPSFVYLLSFVVGIVFLGTAYGKAICGSAWHRVDQMGITILLGLLGTMLLFFGLRVLLGFFAEHGGKHRKLHVFNFRQLQEQVIRRSNLLAISSLMMLVALCCFGAGVAIVSQYSQSEPHILDYTFGSYQQDTTAIRKILSENNLASQFLELFDIKLGRIKTTEDYNHAFQMDSVMEALKEFPESKDRNILLNNFSYVSYPYLLSLSEYNYLLSLAGMSELELKDEEAAVFIDLDFITEQQKEMLDSILASKPACRLDQETLFLSGTVQTTKFVTDRSITLSFALILPDKAFDFYTCKTWEVYLNGILDRESMGNVSLMSAIAKMNTQLDKLELSYESYLQNMGRQMFYMVAASYITIYLAIIFLIVANTVLGVQFLTGQQKSSRRYQILIRLGITYNALCQSAGKQIVWYFGIPTFVAIISSLFGIRALFTGFLPSVLQNNIMEMMWISAAMLLVLFVIEYLYILAVKSSSSRYLLTLMEPQREE